MKVLILGRKWTVAVLSGDLFKKRFEDEAAAFTLPESREIIICEDEFSLDTVRHEVWHSYYASLCVASATLSAEQVEEVSAELYALHGPEMDVMSRRIFKHFA